MCLCELFIDKVPKEVKMFHTTLCWNDYIHNNLTFEERLVLGSLQKRTDVLYKPADKGGLMVVIGRSLYKEETVQQLNDQAIYETLNGDHAWTEEIDCRCV